MKKTLERIATICGEACAHPMAFVVSCIACIIWAVTGPLFGFSDTWQLVINTSTTIATFLIGFLILNVERRGTKALQLEIRELIRAMPEARTRLAQERLEEATDERLAEEEAELARLTNEAPDTP